MFSHSPHPHLLLLGDGFMVVLEIAVKSGSFLERGGGGTEEEKLAGCRVFLAFPRTAVENQGGLHIPSPRPCGSGLGGWRRWSVGAKVHHGS